MTGRAVRVLVDATALGSGLGGDETFLRGMLEGLARAAGPGDRFPLLVRPGAAVPAGVAEDPRFPVTPCARGRGIAHYAYRLPRAVARWRGRADAVCSLTHAPAPSALPSVLVLGDLSFRHHPEHYPWTARRRLELLAPRQARRARAVITFSEHARADLVAELGLDPGRVFAVPCRVEDLTVTAAEERAAGRAAAALGVRPPFVLYLGNLHPRKNVARLVEAYTLATRRSPAVAACRLVIAGARWWRGGAEDRAATAAPEGSVRMLGRVDEPLRRYLLREAAALAYPSIHEGFGLPPVEAMRVGTPVLASDRSAIPEVCGDAALLVDPLDTEAIARGLTRILEDEGLRATLRERGVARAARYTTEATGAAALAALQAAVHGPSRAAAGAVRTP